MGSAVGGECCASCPCCRRTYQISWNLDRGVVLVNVHRVSMSESERKDQSPRPRPAKAVWVPGPPPGVGCLWAGKNQRVLGTFLGRSKAPGSRSPRARSITARKRASAQHLGVGGSGGAKLWRLPGPQDPCSDPATPWHRTWPLPSPVEAWPREEGETEAQRGWGHPSQAQHRPRPAVPARGPGGAWILLRSLPPVGTSHTCPCGGSFFPRGWCRRGRGARELGGARPVRPSRSERGPSGFLACGSPGPEVKSQLLHGPAAGPGPAVRPPVAQLPHLPAGPGAEEGLRGPHTTKRSVRRDGPSDSSFYGDKSRLLPRKLCLPELILWSMLSPALGVCVHVSGPAGNPWAWHCSHTCRVRATLSIRPAPLRSIRCLRA